MLQNQYNIADLSPLLLQPIALEQRLIFERDGAICLRQLMDRAWIEMLRQATDEARDQPGPTSHFWALDGEPGGFYEESGVWLRHPAFKALVYDSPLGAIAGALLGSAAIRFNFDQIFYKDAGTVKPSNWHQDSPYLPITGRQCLGLWVSLDAVPRDYALEFLRGSHRWGAPFRPRNVDGPGLPMPDIEACRESFDIIGWAVEPGDVVAFHIDTIHGARGGRNVAQKRRTIATRWTGDDIRFAEPALVTPHVPVAPHEIGAPMSGDLYPLVWQN